VKGAAANLLVSGATLLILFVGLEGGVRLLSREDASGNVFLGQAHIPPYRLEVEATREALAAYRDRLSRDPDGIAYVFDDHLGWTPNPRFRGGTYWSAQALRNPGRVFSATPQGDTVRIALFGDSFTQSLPLISVEESWGFLLERRLRGRGVPVEVLNFGVGGYGVDQAYLRWEHDGKRYNPHVVVLGFFPDDAVRNLRIFRSAGTPWTKPRFVQSDDTLTLVNYPVVPLESVTRALQAMDSSQLGLYDSYYRAQRHNYALTWWRLSRLFGFAEALVKESGWARGRGEWSFDFSGEAAPLTMAIVRRFKRSARTAGATFVILSIPSPRDARDLAKGMEPAHAALLDSMGTVAPLVRPDSAFASYLARVSYDRIYLPDGHLSPEGDSILAGCIGAYFESVLHVEARRDTTVVGESAEDGCRVPSRGG
jgi:hypothetical protein